MDKSPSTASRKGHLAVITLALLLAACGDGDPEASPSSSSPAHPSATNAAPPSSSSPSPTPTTPSLEECVSDTLAELSPEQRVGQLFMGAIFVDQAPADIPAALGDSAAGSVILLGNSTAGADAIAQAVSDAVDIAGSPANVAPIVAVDQEGGQVQRLQGPGFDRMPSAEEQTALPDLRDSAASWAEQLKTVGVNLNLAPVADVVPDDIGDSNAPIGKLDRGYGPNAAAVAEDVTAFVEGMAGGGIATAVKHFPGLGKVEGNTDFSSDVVDTSTTRDDADVEPFRAGVAAGARFVMVALATYTEIDADRFAVFSPAVLDSMIRDDLGFDGIVISDAMDAEQVSGVPAGERVLNFLSAGGDMAIVADPNALLEMTSAVVDKAGGDDEFRALVDDRAARVLSVKAEMGLLPCG